MCSVLFPLRNLKHCFLAMPLSIVCFLGYSGGMENKGKVATISFYYVVAQTGAETRFFRQVQVLCILMFLHIPGESFIYPYLHRSWKLFISTWLDVFTEVSVATAYKIHLFQTDRIYQHCKTFTCSKKLKAYSGVPSWWKNFFVYILQILTFRYKPH